jgi:hypothetical protein
MWFGSRTIAARAGHTGRVGACDWHCARRAGPVTARVRRSAALVERSTVRSSEEGRCAVTAQHHPAFLFALELEGRGLEVPKQARARVQPLARLLSTRMGLQITPVKSNPRVVMKKATRSLSSPTCAASNPKVARVPVQPSSAPVKAQCKARVVSVKARRVCSPAKFPGSSGKPEPTAASHENCPPAVNLFARAEADTDGGPAPSAPTPRPSSPVKCRVVRRSPDSKTSPRAAAQPSGAPPAANASSASDCAAVVSPARKARVVLRAITRSPLRKTADAAAPGAACSVTHDFQEALEEDRAVGEGCSENARTVSDSFTSTPHSPPPPYLCPCPFPCPCPCPSPPPVRALSGRPSAAGAAPLGGPARPPRRHTRGHGSAAAHRCGAGAAAGGHWHWHWHWH